MVEIVLDGLRGCESTDTGSAVILWKESNSIGFLLRYAHGLVPILLGIVTGVNLVTTFTAWIVFYHAKVVFRFVKGVWVPRSLVSDAWNIRSL